MIRNSQRTSECTEHTPSSRGNAWSCATTDVSCVGGRSTLCQHRGDQADAAPREQHRRPTHRSVTGPNERVSTTLWTRNTLPEMEWRSHTHWNVHVHLQDTTKGLGTAWHLHALLLLLLASAHLLHVQTCVQIHVSFHVGNKTCMNLWRWRTCFQQSKHTSFYVLSIRCTCILECIQCNVILSFRKVCSLVELTVWTFGQGAVLKRNLSLKFLRFV